MRYYICDSCKFQFTRSGEPDRCPDCGKENVREANRSEIEDFLRLQEEKKHWDDVSVEMDLIKKQNKEEADESK